MVYHGLLQYTMFLVYSVGRMTYIVLVCDVKPCSINQCFWFTVVYYGILCRTMDHGPYTMVYHGKQVTMDTMVHHRCTIVHGVPWYTSRNYHVSLDTLILQSTSHRDVTTWYYHLVVPRYAVVGYYQVVYHGKTKK